MPAYTLTDEWSDPIELQAGDVVQNGSPYVIEIHPGDPESDDGGLLVPAYNNALKVDNAVTIRVRRVKEPKDELRIIRGF